MYVIPGCPEGEGGCCPTIEYENNSTNWWKYVELIRVAEDMVPVVALLSSHRSRLGELVQHMVSGSVYVVPASAHTAVLLLTELELPKDL